MKKYISSAILQSLLLRTKLSALNLSSNAKLLLAHLLAFANKDLSNGYKSWPSAELISEVTGFSITTFGRAKNELVKAGFVQYVQGKGSGNSNTYYIDGQRIVDCAVMSGQNAPTDIVAPMKVEDKQVAKKQQKRNTSGLVQNQQKKEETPVQTPQAVPELDYDDPDLPEWAK